MRLRLVPGSLANRGCIYKKDIMGGEGRAEYGRLKRLQTGNRCPSASVTSIRLYRPHCPAQKGSNHREGYRQTHLWASHHGIDAYQAAVSVDERTAGIPRPQVHADLDELSPPVWQLWRGAHVNDHPGRCRARDTPRMPEGHHPVPWSESPGSRVGNGWETTSRHRQRGQITVAIGGHHAGWECVSVRQGNLRGSMVEDMGVRDDQPVGVPDGPGPSPTPAVADLHQTRADALNYGRHGVVYLLQYVAHLALHEVCSP